MVQTRAIGVSKHQLRMLTLVRGVRNRASHLLPLSPGVLSLRDRQRARESLLGMYLDNGLERVQWLV